MTFVSEQKFDDLTFLVKEHAAGRFENTIAIEIPIIGKKILEEESIDGAEWTHELFAGARVSTTIGRDFGRRPKGGSLQPVKARERPAIITTTLALGLAAALAKLSDDETTKHFDAVMTEHENDCARVLGQSLFGGAMNPYAAAEWDGTLDGAEVEVTFDDVSMFIVGAGYDFIDLSADKSYVVRCSDVSPGAIGDNSENVAGTVTFVNDVEDPSSDEVVALTDVDVAVGDSFRLRGSTAGFGGSTDVEGTLNSFDSIAGSGAEAELHEVELADLPGWKGTYRAVDAPYNQELVASFMGFARKLAGEALTDVIVNEQLAVAHEAAGGLHGPSFGVPALSITAARPRALDRSADKYGALDQDDDGLRIAGKRGTIDPHVQATRLIAFSRRRTKLAVWQKFEPEMERGNAVFRNRQTLSLESFITGMYKLVTTKRSSVAILDGFTNI